MDRPQLTIMANKFQSVFEASRLDARGNALEFCQRQRLITPFRFGLSVIALSSTKQVHSIADLHRAFNALWESEVSYKAFYNQVAKPSCAEFLRTSLCDLMGKLTLKVLGFPKGHALNEFNRIILQDGSSFALHAALAQVFPGRFNAVKPAAVELHCTMDVLRDAPITIVLTPDTDSEQAYLPEPQSLKGALFLADRGYLNLTYLPKERYDIDTVCLIYKLRWQVELLFKEWKSYANLHAFNTTDEHIAEALIWASLAAAALTRFLAHATELLLQVVMSTRKAAMSPAYVFPELFRALRHGNGPWFRRAFEAVIRYLGANAKRAHP